MPTNTEYLKTLITTAGGDVSSLPDNLESTHYKALIEALANGTGGGGASGGASSGWSKVAEFVYDLNRELTIDSYTASNSQIHFTTPHELKVNDYILTKDWSGFATKGANAGYITVTEIVDEYTVVCSGIFNTNDVTNISKKVEVAYGRVCFSYRDKLTKPYGRMKIEGRVCFLDSRNQWTFSTYWDRYGGEYFLGDSQNGVFTGNTVLLIKRPIIGAIGGITMYKKLTTNNGGYLVASNNFGHIGISLDYAPIPDKQICLPRLVYNGLKITVEESDEFDW